MLLALSSNRLEAIVEAVKALKAAAGGQAAHKAQLVPKGGEG